MKVNRPKFLNLLHIFKFKISFYFIAVLVLFFRYKARISY